MGNNFSKTLQVNLGFPMDMDSDSLISKAASKEFGEGLAPVVAGTTAAEAQMPSVKSTADSCLILNHILYR